MYFVTIDSRTGELIRLEMVPTQMQRLQVRRASYEDAKWLVAVLNRQGRKLGTHVERKEDGHLFLHWEGTSKAEFSV